MCIKTPLPVVQACVAELHEALETYQPGAGLARLQRDWLSCCLMGMLVSHALCWARCERASLGHDSLAALAWMFRHSKMPWECWLQMRVRVIRGQYGVTHGFLVLDDSDTQRGNVITRMFNAHTLTEKVSGGYIHGHSSVL